MTDSEGATMTAWLKNNVSTILLWAALIVGAAILFAVSRGTPYQQLGTGLLISSIALLVAMAVFEVIWLAAASFFGDEATPRGASKSPDRRR